MICPYTKFHMSRLSDSLVIAIKLKAKYSFHTAAMLLFYILQKNYYNESCTFVKDLLPYTISSFTC
jgi:hypothetical protein